MTHENFFPVVLVAVLAVAQGCSDGGSGPPDPTSAQALHKTKSMTSGTTCVKVDYSSYGSSHSETETPMCMDSDCNASSPSDDTEFAGGATYYGSTYYKNVVYFEGTCADPHPITCDQRTATDDCGRCGYEQCCVAVALCEDDPNCVAVLACVANCKNDKSCAGRCVQNGESVAIGNLTKAAKCLQSSCKDRC